jgi:hypothetical protein
MTTINKTPLTVEMCNTRQVCIGDGEVAIELFYNGIAVGEQVVSNGTRYDEQAGEEHSTRLSYQYVEDIPASGVYWTCPCCGFEIDNPDELYAAEYPNSCDMWLGQQIDEHRERCDEDQEYNARLRAICDAAQNRLAFSLRKRYVRQLGEIETWYNRAFADARRGKDFYTLQLKLNALAIRLNLPELW